MIFSLLVATALTPLFAPGATMTINGENPQPLPPAVHFAVPSYLSWTPVAVHSPTPTPIPEDQGMGGGASGPWEPDPAWQPSSQVVVYPVDLDVSSWRATVGLFREQYYNGTVDDRQLVIDFLHEYFQAINAALMSEPIVKNQTMVNVRLQIQHVNFWDNEGTSPPNVLDSVAWWDAHPEYRHGPTLFVNNGDPSAHIDAPCDGRAYFYLFWSSFLLYPNATTYGGYAATPYRLALHEIGHLLGLYHADCYTPPVNECTSGCYTGQRHCPADMADLSLMSYCGGTGSVDAYCGYANRFTPRLARVLRYRAENAPCAVAVDDPPCAGPDTDGDGIPDSCDNCPSVPNHWQGDWNEDGVGDACPPRPPQCADAPPGMMSTATPLALPIALLVWARRRHT